MADGVVLVALEYIAGICRMDKPPSGPFAAWPQSHPDSTGLAVDADLQTRLTPVQRSFPNLSVGVLRFDAALRPSFFGWNEHVECDLGSMGKLAILYAAFQLRDDVRTALNQLGVNPGNVDARLRQMWADSCIAGLPVAAGTAPYLGRIFDFTKDPVEFQGFAGCGMPPDFTLPPDAVVDHFDDTHDLEHFIKKTRLDYMQRWAKLLDLSYAEQLWLMTRWSDNAAATVCAAAVGMPYIFALMTKSGLYRSIGSGDGLRVIKGYEDPPHWNEFSRVIVKPTDITADDWNAKLERYRNFIQPFGDVDFLYQPERKRIAAVQGKKKVEEVGLQQAATVVSLASLMVSLVQGKLIRPAAAVEMASFVRLPRRTGLGTATSGGSYIVKALRNPASIRALIGADAPQVLYTDVWSKLGIDGPTFVDWAYLAPTPTKKLGIIVLNYQSDRKDENGDWVSPFDETSDAFNDCVRAIVAAL